MSLSMSLSSLQRTAGACVLSCLVLGVAAAQTPAPSADPTADSKIVETAPHPKTKAQLTDEAWVLLENALNDEKHVDTQIQALSALGTMGTNARTAKMISKAFADPEVDVRTAAVLAAGQTKNPSLKPGLQKLLDDKEPQVAYTAASTLWKMGDHSGEDLLIAVMDGDQRANATLMHGTMHSANRELHNPAALAKLGAMQGASMLLGPFGFGITAYEYIKKNGGESARSVAIEELSQVHSPDMRKEFLDAIGDKDASVRIAAAKALRSYHDAEVSGAIAKLFDDSKKPVQFAAAASYLISAGAVATPLPARLP